MGFNMQNRKFVSGLALAAAIVVSPFAQAAGNSVEEIQAVSERIAVLEARLKELELENKTKKLIAENAQLGAAAQRSANVDADSDYGVPTVDRVEGLKGALEAVLVYRGNVRQRVKEGDQIFGSMVRRIAINEVVLVDVKSGKANRLQFGAGPVIRDGAGQPGMPAGPLPGAVPGVPNR